LKKIDFHIHTLPTIRDANFNFNLDNLQKYVSAAKLDAIAITNHNVFNGIQFRAICEALSVVVFPGIEINLDCGHILLISDESDLEDFENKTELIAQRITQNEERISVDILEEIFQDLNKYMVIPHYDKEPCIKGETLNRISYCISAGEVDSAKKFIRAIKDNTKPTPALFSDVRICEELAQFPTRQTFIDCGELTLNAIKVCLKDKGKVSLSESDGNMLFQVFSDGQKLSTGLNVLLGERSSGKTFTLNRINGLVDNVKYIRQFSLVQQDSDAYEREFNNELQRERSRFIEEYLAGFKIVLNDVMNIDLKANERMIEKYVGSLLKSAEESDKRDAFSKTSLFDETEFPISDDSVLIALIGSVRQVIENIEYRAIIDKHLDINNLKRLSCELIELLWAKSFIKKKKKFVNSLIRDVRESLKMRTSAVQIEDVDLYRGSMDKRKVDRFSEIVKGLQKEAIISEESIQGFSVVARKGSFESAGEIKTASGIRTAFRDSFIEYGQPYEYLRSLLANNNLTPSEHYKLFAKISYRILNKYGFEVSGGERSEFRLLQEIKNAHNHDILLVDEPESSFDNMFLKSDVNQIIKKISESMPVVVVTHNNTVGASVGADYLLYARKEIEGSDVKYKLYSGHPTDRVLKSIDGKTIINHEIMMNSLEAGYDTYNSRRQGYEAIKN
jgi:ABC-type dipeptide/oligopeptide/nickel transport system ATPase component